MLSLSTDYVEGLYVKKSYHRAGLVKGCQRQERSQSILFVMYADGKSYARVRKYF
jgi:hypothetical protein